MGTVDQLTNLGPRAVGVHLPVAIVPSGRLADGDGLLERHISPFLCLRYSYTEVAEELAEAAADAIAASISGRARPTADGATTVARGGRDDR